MTKKIDGTFLVLPEYLGYADFQDLASQQGWKLIKTYSGDGKLEPFDEVWATSNRRNSIHFVDDPITGTKHLWVWGPDDKELLLVIFRRLPAYEPDDLIEGAFDELSHNEMVDNLFRIAVAFPNFNKNAFHVFQAYSHHPDPLIRKATMQAIGYRLWDESLGLLERVAEDDADEGVRRFTSDMLRDLPRRPGGGPT